MSVDRQATSLLLLDYLAVRLMLTFLVMGAWVSIIALATEKRGGKLGGFLAGIPSTSAFSFLFIGLYISPEAAAAATNPFPIFMSLTGLFLLCFGFAARKGFAFGIIASVLIWFLASFLIIYSGLGDFGLSLTSSVVVSVVVYLGFRWRLRPRSPGRAKLRYTWQLLLLRFVLAGGVVSLAVLMSQIGIPVLSGMFAAFPALSISTLIVVQMSKEPGGTERAIGITMSMMVSIMLMCIPYSVAVHYLYPDVGVVYGTVVAYAVAIAIGIPYYLLAERLLVPRPNIE